MANAAAARPRRAGLSLAPPPLPRGSSGGAPPRLASLLAGGGGAALRRLACRPAAPPPLDPSPPRRRPAQRCAASPAGRPRQRSVLRASLPSPRSRAGSLRRRPWPARHLGFADDLQPSRASSWCATSTAPPPSPTPALPCRFDSAAVSSPSSSLRTTSRPTTRTTSSRAPCPTPRPTDSAAAGDGPSASVGSGDPRSRRRPRREEQPRGMGGCDTAQAFIVLDLRSIVDCTVTSSRPTWWQLHS
ncbi:hypothetical protein BS78_10G147800 [Paspalum vaginatum]|nr:hypothetical protein BS78_10G147800 [Paspalum vaginatum]